MFDMYVRLEENHILEHNKDRLRVITSTILPPLPALTERDTNVIHNVTLSSPMVQPSLQSTPKGSAISGPSASNDDSFVSSSDLSEAENSLEISGISVIKAKWYGDFTYDLDLYSTLSTLNKNS